MSTGGNNTEVRGSVSGSGVSPLAVAKESSVEKDGTSSRITSAGRVTSQLCHCWKHSVLTGKTWKGGDNHRGRFWTCHMFVVQPNCAFLCRS